MMNHPGHEDLSDGVYMHAGEARLFFWGSEMRQSGEAANRSGEGLRRVRGNGEEGGRDRDNLDKCRESLHRGLAAAPSLTARSRCRRSTAWPAQDLQPRAAYTAHLHGPVGSFPAGSPASQGTASRPANGMAPATHMCRVHRPHG
jgi:hypothetical protein